jgi:hypothetical protein
MMRGRIWFESEPGQGSQFHFTAQIQIVAKTADPGALLPGENFRGDRVSGLLVDVVVPVKFTK